MGLGGLEMAESWGPNAGHAHQEASVKARSWLNDRGAAFPFIALTLVVLAGMAALAIDLGWLYLNTSRVQSGAHAGALAGVVHLPAFPNDAASDAVNGANANGWNVGWVNGQQIPGGGLERLDWRHLSNNRMEVTLEAVVDTFFIRVLGFDSVTIRRTATAEASNPLLSGSLSTPSVMAQTTLGLRSE
jgi:Flp pilus assembly protein TadG